MFIQTNFETIEEGFNNLKKAVNLRDSMGGSLYYNIMEDNCCEIANKLLSMGANKTEIEEVMGR